MNETTIPPRDDPKAIAKRLDAIRQRIVREYAAIAQWNPNDRPLKVVRAHLTNIEAYLDEVEQEIKHAGS
jgi:hypothetical protein